MPNKNIPSLDLNDFLSADSCKKEKFVKDFVAVWTKLMNADRQNLKKLGFKTFEQFWSEAYDHMQGKERLTELKRAVDKIMAMDNAQLVQMYQETVSYTHLTLPTNREV